MQPKESNISWRKAATLFVNGTTLPDLKQIKNTAIYLNSRVFLYGLLTKFLPWRNVFYGVHFRSIVVNDLFFNCRKVNLF